MSSQQTLTLSTPRNQKTFRNHEVWEALAHGICMALAFAFVLPLGIAIARYRITINRTFYRPHVFIQVLAIIVVIIGMFTGLHMVKWVNIVKVPYSHGILGMLAAVGVLFQVILRILGHCFPSLKSATSRIHRYWGVIVVILGISNGLTGIYYSGAKTGYLIGYCFVASFMFTLCVISFALALYRRRGRQASVDSAQMGMLD